MTKHTCGYEDCFSCPFKDCTVNGTFAEEPNINDFIDLPKQSEAEKKAKKREYMKRKYRERKK